jgi:hypothetical protein
MFVLSYRVGSVAAAALGRGRSALALPVPRPVPLRNVASTSVCSVSSELMMHYNND